MAALADELHKQLDQDGSVLQFLLDLRAAFSRVVCDFLTLCLALIGVCGAALKWLTSFHQGRGQGAALRGERESPRHSLVCGVPRGGSFPQ